MHNRETMELTEQNLKHGTTTVGIACTDGVVMAADARAIVGYTIESKTIQKVIQVDDRAAMSIAGMAGDGQMLAKLLKAELALYKVNNGKNATIETSANLLSAIMHGSRYYPYMAVVLLGGLDEKGRLFSFDPVGSLTEDPIASTGSGSTVAYGVMEDYYDKKLTTREALPVVVKAIATAMKRDVATGERIEAVIITKDSFKRIGNEENRRMLKE